MEKKSVLIVEDDRAVANVLKLKLENAGYVIGSAYDGAAALKMVERDGYGLVLLDLILPDVDGFRVLEKLRARDSALPVVILTNLAQDEDRDRIEALGVSGYFIKSQTSLNEIVDVVTSLLNKN